MTDAPSWSHRIDVADLPQEGRTVALAPNAAVRADLARQVGVIAVPALAARLTVAPDGLGGATVEGTLAATVRQTCGVTLDLFDNRIDEPIFVRFAPQSAASAGRGETETDEEDPPDPLDDGTVDLAAVVTEFLMLAIDPYPRRPGAVFEPPTDARESGGGAFAALEKLKQPRPDKD